MSYSKVVNRVSIYFIKTTPYKSHNIANYLIVAQNKPPSGAY